MLTGPDVSNLQGAVDMRAVRAAGHSFVGIKVSEGGDYADPCFKANRAGARAAGLVCLLYHFARPGNGRGYPVGDPRSAILEALWFLRCVGDLQPGEIAVCDLEDPNVPAGVDLSAWMAMFLHTVDQATHRGGGSDSELYTYGPYAQAHLRLRPANAPHLWLAAYSANPVTPPPWPSWTFHQFTSSGTCPGIRGRCDLNRFTGPIEALQQLAAVPQEDNVDTKIVAVTTDPHTGKGWATTGIPDGAKFSATHLVGADGLVYKVGFSDTPALDGEAVVKVDLGITATLAPVTVQVLVAYRP